MTRALWILVVVLAAAGAWLVMDGFGAPDVAPIVRPTADDTADGDTRDPGAPESAVFGDREDTAFGDVDAGFETDERVEVEGAGEARVGPRIRVLAFGTREPVEGAEVKWIERRDAVEKGLEVHHESEYAERLGLSATTDAEGYVQLPPVTERLLIIAQHEGMFGYIGLWRRHRRVETIVLEPDHALSVFVHDGTGKGVPDVPVGVYERVNRRNDRRLNLKTDAEGRIRVPHVQFRTWRLRPKPEKVWVALLVPLTEPVVREFPGDAPPPETVELVLPPTGSVTVNVTAFGEPFVNAGRVTLRVPDRPREFSALGRGFDAPRERKFTGTSTIEFPFVGLDLQLTATVVLDDDDFAWGTEPFVGPIEGGQNVEVDAPMPSDIGLLVGRLVDAEGEPWGDTRPSFLISTRAGRLEGERLPVDSEGVFALPYEIREPKPPFTLEVRDEGDEGPVGATLSLPPPLQVGVRVNVGTIVMQPFDVAVFGRVVDDVGAPIRRARISMQLLRDFGGNPPRQDWRDEPYSGTETDENGEYVIYGDAPLARARVRARAGGHMPATSPDVAFGSRMDLRLQRTASFRGNLQAPEWVTSRALQIRLAGTREGQRGRDARVDLRRGNGRFRFVNVPPGVYDFEVRLRGFPDPVVSHPGVVVEPGMREPDPRFATVDLRASVFRYRLRSVTANGEMFPNPGSPLLARLPRADGKTHFSGFNWRNGRVEIFHSQPQLEVVQLGTGTRPKQSVISYGDSDLVFEQLQPVEIELPGLRALVGEDRIVRVSTVLVGETGLPSSLRGIDQQRGDSRGYSRAQLSKSGGAWLSEGDVVRVPLMRDGKYRVVLRVRQRGVRGEESRDAGTIEVKLDPYTPNRHVVNFDAAAIRDAMQKMDARKRDS